MLQITDSSLLIIVSMLTKIWLHVKVISQRRAAFGKYQAPMLHFLSSTMFLTGIRRKCSKHQLLTSGAAFNSRASACLGNNGLPIIRADMKPPLLVSKGSLARLLQGADEARQRLDFPRAIEMLERAARMAPGNGTILFNLAHAQGKNFDYAAAERSFERAIRIAPKKTEALATAAMRAIDFGSSVLAQRYYQLASEQKDATPDIFIALAESSAVRRRRRHRC